jgi:hypothetical protein
MPTVQRTVRTPTPPGRVLPCLLDFESVTETGFVIVGRTLKSALDRQ